MMAMIEKYLKPAVLSSKHRQSGLRKPASQFIVFIIGFFAFFAVSLNGRGQTLFDSFSDGNFTASPVWGGNTSYWQILTSSNVSTGAANSYTLNLNGPAVAETDYLSSQISSWGISQEWRFFIGRQSSQTYTAANQVYFWFYANESTLTSGTVDGYRIAIGQDGTGPDYIRLEYIVNGSVSSTVITSSGGVTYNVADVGFLVRVTRSSAGVWALYTSTLPTTNGTGAIATDVPSDANTSVSQGSATDNSLVPATNGYIGVAALHSTGAAAIDAVEFDQIYFTPTSACTAPTIQAYNITFPSVQSNQLGVSWTNGNGSKRVVIINTSNSFTNPTDGTDPAANSVYGGSGEQVVYNNSGSSFTVTGLTASTTYWFRIYEYNCTGSSTKFYTATATDNPKSQATSASCSAPSTQANTISFSGVTTSQMNISWSNGDGANRAVFVKQANSGTAAPVDNTTYTANTSFTSGTQIGSTGWYCVYNGTGTSVTVTNLAASTDYMAHVCEYNCSAGSEKYLSSSVTDNPKYQTTASSCTAPTTQATNISFASVQYNQMDVSWTNGDGSKRIVIINTSNFFTDPTDGTDPAANSVYGGSGEQTVYNNNGNSFTVSGLTATTTYYFRIYEYNCTGGNTKYIISAGTNNPNSQATTAASGNTEVIVEWNFPNLTDDNVADAGITANLAKTISTAGGTGTVVYNIAGNTTSAASTDGWNNGNGTKYWSINFVSTGYSGLKLSSKQRSSNTAPKDWKIQYDAGSGWTDLTTVTISAQNSWYGVTEYSLPSSCDNKASISIRWIMTSNISVNNGTVASGGNSRIDDIIVIGTSGNTINTGTISGSPFCISTSTGISVTVPFTSSGTFNTNNIYTAELSDATGSFSVPTVIGTLASTANSGNISATIPANTPDGSAYRIRVISDDPYIIGANNGVNFYIVLNPPEVSNFNANTSSDQVVLAWNNAVGCYDDYLIVGKASGVVTATPTGNGSLYTANTVFGTGGSGANLPSNEYCVLKGTGTTVIVTGLTNGITYFFKIFVRNGTSWSSGVILSCTPNTILTGDYQSTGSGNWTNIATWQMYNGSSWVAATDYPNYSAGNPTPRNVTIKNGHTVTLNNSPMEVNDLIVESDAKLFCNLIPNGSNNNYISIYGNNLICDGTIGNGSTIDALGVNIEGANVTISGTGTFDCNRLRKNFNSSSTPASNDVTNLIISMNINLRWNEVSGTQIYNNSASTLNITLNAGSTLNLLVSGVGNSGNACINKTAGTGGTGGGTWTINGTMNIPGILYATTSSTVRPCKWIIGNGGVVNCNQVNCDASGSITHEIEISDGGKLNMTTNTGFTNFSLTNNVYDFQAGSIVEYSSSSGTQVIQPTQPGFIYSNLLISTNGGTKQINGSSTDLTVTKNLTITGSVLDANGKTIYIGGDWGNYSEAGFTEGTSTVNFNGTTQNMDCAGGEIFNKVIFSNNDTKTINDDITVNSDLTISGTAVLNGNSKNITIKGNWSDYGTAGFTEANTVVIFNGTSQTLSCTGGEDFYDLVNNNTSLTISNNATVANNLFLTSGKIITGTNEVNVTNNVTNAIQNHIFDQTVSNYTSSSYIYGNLKRAVAATGSYDLPVGDVSNYELATINVNSATGVSTLSAKFTAADAGTTPSVYVNGTLVNTLLNEGYWTISPNTSLFYDDFQDNNYTSNPTWTVQSGGWTIDNLSGNYWLEGTDAAATEILSSPSTQAYGIWGFKYSFDVATNNEYVRYFLMMSADNANPSGANADGYYVWVDGGITAGARLQLRRLDNGVPTTLITTDWTPGTAWHTVRITRNASNIFELFYDNVSKGTATDNTYTTSAYTGIWNTGVNTNDNHKIDDITKSNYNYDVTLNAVGQSNGGGTPSLYCVIKRPNSSSDWISEGTHSPSTQMINTGSTEIITAKRTGVTSFSDFDVAKGSSEILPVELISFNVICNEGKIIINWVTASEENSDYFTIEKSSDDVDWSELATVPAAGYSNSVLNYSYTDINDTGVKTYYRLKQTDFNGVYDYFGPVVTSCEENLIGAFNAYPNPANDLVNCSVFSFFSTEVEAGLYNLFGQLIMKKNVNLSEGSNNFSFDVSKLSSGVYYITLRNSSGSYFERKQLIVQ